MEAATERRDPQVTRVPLDDVLVDLYPEGLDESFPADAIDVGLGGLAMRSAVLPDIGSRMRCRFRSPEDGATVAAEAEVVWAADSGPNTGQFGLRFTELDQDDAERIAELVDAWHDSLGALSIANDTDSLAETPVSRRVSLRLDGVGPAVETELVHGDDEAMIVEQPLPFLTLGKGVESEGRRGVLEAVDLRLDGDTPRLTLTVLFAQPAASTLAEAAPREALPPTLDEAGEAEDSGTYRSPVVAREIDARTGAGAVSAPGSHSLAEDDSLAEPASALADGSDELPEPSPSFHDCVADDDELEAEHDEAELSAADSAPALAVAPATKMPAPKAKKADPLLSELDANPKAALRQALGRVLPVWVKVRAWVLVAWAKMGPWARIAGSRVRGLAVRCFTTVRNLRGGERSTKRQQRRPQQPQRQTRAPRRQARPGERARPAQSKEPARGPRKIGRYVVAGLGVVLLIALGSMAFASGSEVGVATKAPLPEPEPEPVVEAAPAMMDPEAGDEGAAREAAEPEGGQLAEPSFPSMPSAQEAGQPLVFGEARVPGGREYRLRLSVPPTALRGEPTSDGFKVTLEGANAVDGARRIGATHPRVAVASILNEGERAVLTIRFAAGANPAYRVEASGDALLITIGR